MKTLKLKKNLVKALKQRTEMKLLRASKSMNTQNCISDLKGNRGLISQDLGCKKGGKKRGDKRTVLRKTPDM